MANQPVAILFQRFGPYHHARVTALVKHLEVVGIEYSTVDNTYSWDTVEGRGPFEKITVFPNEEFSDQSFFLMKKKLFGVLASVDPKAVLIPGWADRMSIMALNWCRRQGVPAVVMSDSANQDRARSFFKEIVKRMVVRNFSAGFVAGKPHVEYLESLGMQKRCVAIGYDVVDNDYFRAGAYSARESASIFRQKFSLPERYFLVSSRFIPEKNLVRLLHAYSKYRSQIGRFAWGLVILGDGSLKGEIHDAIDLLELAENVQLAGFQQYSELPIFYGLANAFILASTAEPWGLVVNEAMASGLPVVVSNRCGCAADLVEEGRNGYSFNPYDIGELANLMLKISSDRNSYVTMGSASQEIIAGWNLEAFGKGARVAVEMALATPKKRTRILDRLLLWKLSHK